MVKGKQILPIMFTGLIQDLAQLTARTQRELTFRLPDLFDELEIGASIALDGVCLTIVDLVSSSSEFSVELSPETLSRTTLNDLTVSEEVNVELPLEVSSGPGRLEGHYVQGHVDTMGRISSVTRKQSGYVYRLSCPSEYRNYLVEKGAVAVDGISLTPYQIKGGSFAVSVIPHTYTNTTLKNKRAGSSVNVEYDILAKYAQKRNESKTSPDLA